MSDFATWVEKNRGLWTRVYDEVIVPDFEKEWKKSTNAYQYTRCSVLITCQGKKRIRTS